MPLSRMDSKKGGLARYTSRCAEGGSQAASAVGVAQMVEPLVVVQDVAGSSPVTHPKSSPRGERVRATGGR